MKTIKYGLAAFALSGCGGTTLKQLSNGEVFYPSEKAVLEDLYVDGGECTSAEVTFNMSGYRIICDSEHYFEYRVNRDNINHLSWGDVHYYDNNKDGKVDQFGTYGNIIDVNNSNLDQRYHELLSELHDEEVFNVWRDRWNCRN